MSLFIETYKNEETHKNKSAGLVKEKERMVIKKKKTLSQTQTVGLISRYRTRAK